MRKMISAMLALILACSVLMVSACEDEAKKATKDVKRTLERAEKSVDQINKRMKDSIPGQ